MQAKTSNKISLGEAIDNFINKNHLKAKLDAVRIAALWEKLMTPLIVKHTTSIHFKSGKLYLNFNVPALKNEMYYSREKIKNLINTEMKEDIVKEVLIY